MSKVDIKRRNYEEWLSDTRELRMMMNITKVTPRMAYEARDAYIDALELRVIELESSLKLAGGVQKTVKIEPDDKFMMELVETNIDLMENLFYAEKLALQLKETMRLCNNCKDKLNDL